VADKNKVTVSLIWENNSQFTARANVKRIGQEEYGFVIVSADENNHLVTIWPSLVDIVEKYIKSTMAKILEEMKVT